MTVALGDALRELKEAGGLDMAIVVSSDGLVIESAHDAHVDADAIGAVAASGFLMLDALGRELGQGRAKEAILEYDRSLIVLAPMGDDLVLVVLSRGDSNIGRIRLVLRRSMATVSQAVHSDQTA
jgi:predicted regulator of Ras-like GTPase activity (Roadblock/LC7/MglB family)